MEVLPQAGRNLDFTGHTLLLPGVGGVSGVGELAVDAVIATYGLNRVAIVQSPLLLPGVMSSTWKQQPGTLELTTAAEIYQSEAVPGLSVLQMRTAPVDGRRRALAKEIRVWASQAGILQIVALAPCAAFVRRDTDINSATPIRFTSAGLGNADEIGALLTKAGLSQFVLPLAGPEPETSEEDSDKPSSAERDLIAVHQMLHGGGLARALLLEASECSDKDAAQKPQTLALLAFSAPTLDMRTLEQLARAGCALTAAKLNLQTPEMKFPPSWALEAAQLAGA